MKRILRIFIIETFALYLVSQITNGLVFQNGAVGIVITGIALTIASLIIKPVINILILPLNLLTFGLFKWVGNAITLFLVDLVLTQFSVKIFEFKHFTSDLFTVPSLSLPEGVFSYLGFAFLISLITTFIYHVIN